MTGQTLRDIRSPLHGEPAQLLFTNHFITSQCLHKNQWKSQILSTNFQRCSRKAQKKQKPSPQTRHERRNEAHIYCFSSALYGRDMSSYFCAFISLINEPPEVENHVPGERLQFFWGHIWELQPLQVKYILLVVSHLGIGTEKYVFPLVELKIFSPYMQHPPGSSIDKLKNISISPNPGCK